MGYTDEVAEPNLKPDTPLTHWKYGEWFYTWKANGMLKQVKDPKGKTTVFEYDALGRRTAKINIGKKEINRYIYDGNVLLHEFAYAISERPKPIADDVGRLSFDKEEPTTNLITWVFDEGTFVPSAKITSEGTFSIISDYLGTPILSFDEKGNKVWERELDIYGNVRKGDSHFIPFLYQGQYYDEETGLAYNRFRYYNPDSGTYISQDPIGLLGSNPNFYAYTKDNNSWTDPLGLDCTKKGKAIVKQWEGGGQEGHFSIEIDGLVTHQVGYGAPYSRFGLEFPSQTRILSSKQMSPGDKLVRSVEIDLSDSGAALQKQMDLMKVEDLGKYWPTSNSCLTHVTDVLEAGGENIGKGSKALKAFAEKNGFKPLF